MSEHYSKNCEIESILPQDFAPVVDFIAKSTIFQMSEMCVSYLTEKLAQAYMDKYSVSMESQDKDMLRAISKRKCAEYLVAAAKNIQKDF